MEPIWRGKRPDHRVPGTSSRGLEHRCHRLLNGVSNRHPVINGRSVVYALNRGVPFVVSTREAQVSQDIVRLARALLGAPEAVAAEAARKPAPKKSLFAWR